MSDDEHEVLRANIWDHVYKTGPQSIEQIAEHSQLASETVVALVDHAWFAVTADTVAIATDGD